MAIFWHFLFIFNFTTILKHFGKDTIDPNGEKVD